MKRTVIAGLFLTTVLACGCSTGREPIKAGTAGARTDVFREAPAGTPVPHGYADLRVVASLKTHREGVYPLRKDTHGTPDYVLLLTVDGQTAQIGGTLAGEDCEPRRLSDPEAGEGVRYRFNTVVRLKAGTHTVIVASPDDDVTVEREVTLLERRSYTLALEPVYGTTAQRQRPVFYSPTSFLEGLRGFRVQLNEGHFSENP